MISEQEKEEYDKIVEKIISDPKFQKSARSVYLVKFLYEKAIEGVDVNQFVLGDGLFKGNYDYANNDSKVRVYIHYLRKKLNEYYDTEGRLDSIKLEVKKGQYNLSFKEVKVTEDQKSKKPKYLKNTHFLFYLTTLLLGIFLGTVIVPYGAKMFTNTYLWKGFFDKEANNVCVVGDLMVVSREHNNKRIFSHHPDFIIKSDFVSYVQNNPNPEFSPVDFSFMTKMAPIGVKKLTQWFEKNDHDFSIRMEKSFEMDEIRDNNIIFIGNFRLMAGLKNIFLSNSTMFQLAENDSRIMSVNNGKRQIHQTKYPSINREKSQFGKKGSSVFVEYAMVSFMKLDNGKEALFFSSNHDIGVMATINKFTNPEWMHKFYEDNKFSTNSQFNALFKVSGLERSEVSCELVALELL